MRIVSRRFTHWRKADRIILLALVAISFGSKNGIAQAESGGDQLSIALFSKGDIQIGKRGGKSG
jgi:hypothetical protein